MRESLFLKMFYFVDFEDGSLVFSEVRGNF